ncbi:hypothetical protein [Rufibacter latericius]|uniref:Magnesium citrate secondary transporter n=1 Tax=Rufibacter latericius TaxID=2487040 RepID=A0A3M9N0H3_9BACT|nr:hypothetical protein [Rufibacter latericius]RNI31299.1 hypothetical protein EFB08_01870 [Rufibacter latericius]
MAYRVTGRLNWRTFTPLFWILAALYLAHRSLVLLEVSRPAWLRFYLDDLLCLPLLLTVTLFLMRFLYGPQVRFTKYHVGFVILYVSLAFELVFPTFLPRYTGDPVDVLLYAVGGWLFYRFLNPAYS